MWLYFLGIAKTSYGSFILPQEAFFFHCLLLLEQFKAAEKWAALKAREAEARQRKKEREEARMEVDPEYAAMMAERKVEYERTRAAKRKAEHDALVERAKTDPEAARQLAEQRKYQSEAAVKSYQKMKAAAKAGDPEAIKRYEAHLAKRREDYHKKRAQQEAISA